VATTRERGDQHATFGKPGGQHALQASGLQERHCHLPVLVADAGTFERAAQGDFVIIAGQDSTYAQPLLERRIGLVHEADRRRRHARALESDQ
jgi:hypothetical protein